MLKHLTSNSRGRPVPIVPVAAADFAGWLKVQTAALRRWVTATGFAARRGEFCIVAGSAGGLDRVILGTGDGGGGPWTWAGLPMALPKGTYSIAGRLRAGDATVAALGWALGGYHFGRYRKTKGPRAVLVWPKGADRPAVERAAAATTIARDLINTPAADMGPAELAATVPR
jgi:leucyl aminopeptidase